MIGQKSTFIDVCEVFCCCTVALKRCPCGIPGGQSRPPLALSSTIFFSTVLVHTALNVCRRNIISSLLRKFRSFESFYTERVQCLNLHEFQRALMLLLRLWGCNQCLARVPRHTLDDYTGLSGTTTRWGTDEEMDIKDLMKC